MSGNIKNVESGMVDNVGAVEFNWYLIHAEDAIYFRFNVVNFDFL